MSMATLQLYRNQYVYPDYSNSLQTYGSSMQCTPVGVGLRNGTLRVAGNMDDFMNCNYLAITRNDETIYGWIDNVEYHNANIFNVSYTVDPWRTYRDKIRLGTQFISRRPQETFLRDDMLGAVNPRPHTESKLFTIGNRTHRTFVVQVRVGSGEVFGRTPVQPSPHIFYVTNYQVNNWIANDALDTLMSVLASSAETTNIVTMYSVPYIDISTLPLSPLPVITPGGGNPDPIPGFRIFSDQTNPSAYTWHETDIDFDYDTDEIMRVDHSVQLVIPDAGIINVPDELIGESRLRLRQDIDLYSGAANYMLTVGATGYTNLSVRGSAISSIPVLSDPLDTYVSQNQNALATSLMGDVATIAGGAAMTAGTGGMGGLVGAGAITTGLRNIAQTHANKQDASSRYSNPPAFLGTATVSNFNGRFWMVTTRAHVANRQMVWDNFGYPYNMVGELTFPSSGYIQTQGCSVSSTDGSVPRWAIQEINSMFDNGILVH